MTALDFTDVYAGLKDFQRTTVDYVFQRMYLDDKPARRFLVADEVGLGKTLVARGLIARAIEHLTARGVERIDIVYICSNTNIARQNISRLNVTDRDDFAFASRITLLAQHLRDLKKNPLNFVSFTPGTSFDLKSNLGRQEERVLLYWLLRRAWGYPGTKGPKRLFQGSVADFGNWEAKLSRQRSRARVDDSILEGFLKAMEVDDTSAKRRGDPTLRERFDELIEDWAYERKGRSWEANHRRNLFVGELRNLLAKATIEALEPDLVILDEFQRFKHLLAGESDAAQLAHSMFDYGDGHTEARVLLLSATPYKMYTLADESAEDDHYSDFTQTVDFLLNGESGDFRDDLAAMGHALMRIRNGGINEFRRSKRRVEKRLRSVMARTERLAVTKDRSGMLVTARNESPKLSERDLVEFVAVDQSAATLEAPSPLELWKSAGYFPNFWDDYAIGKSYRKALEQEPEIAAAVRRILAASPGLISWDDFQRFQKLDPGNARLRYLWDQTLEQDVWKLLWIAPSLPYYELGGPFASEAAQGFTKRLVFSSWNVVPKAISTLTSYEAERRMMTGRGRTAKNTAEAREKITELLRFPKTLSGMSAFAVVYPSPTLARLADPLGIAAELRNDGERVTATAVLKRAEQAIMHKLRPHFPAEGLEDERWYWAAALVLDQDLPGHVEWMRKRAPSAWTGSKRDAGGGFLDHLDLARQVDRGYLELGRPPSDLGSILALLAVGGPGNVALRSIGRFTPNRRSPYTDHEMRDQAARLAWSFRSLFNLPEAMALVRSLVRSGPYWQKVLRYCVDGCLQAVLDEYLHVARGWHGILKVDSEADMWPAVQGLADIVALRSSDLHAQDPLDPDADYRMRCRFAVRFGDYKSEEDQQVERAGYVRAAFNSPFWPFVLSTTSIGQEGLDFHLYCHSVTHWNLPANPVDLEQREGRVHRYLGHAVRRNLAAAFASSAFVAKDPWEAMLAAAVDNRAAGVGDLVPYWVFEGNAKIERHVPSLPLSREENRLTALLNSLVFYRAVLGQPRQEDLLSVLSSSPQLMKGLQRDLRMNLSPAPLIEAETARCVRVIRTY